MTQGDDVTDVLRQAHLTQVELAARLHGDAKEVGAYLIHAMPRSWPGWRPREPC